VTDLQRYILGALVADGRVQPDGMHSGRGKTARELADRSNGWYSVATIERALNALCRSTAGNADNPPRSPWAAQVGPVLGVPQSGPGREWVATEDGAAQVGGFDGG
jgi:hypothetical protein